MKRGPLSAEESAKLIVTRIFDHFHHRIHVRYRVLVVNDRFNQRYNWFLEWERPHHRTRSVPLHSISYQDGHLGVVIRLVKKSVGMTFVYRGFPDGTIAENC